MLPASCVAYVVPASGVQSKAMDTSGHTGVPPVSSQSIEPNPESDRFRLRFAFLVLVALSLAALVGGIAKIATERTPWSFPIGVALVVIGTPLLVAMRRAVRAVRGVRRAFLGKCGTCGYGLDGVHSASCPECGTKLPF